MKKIFTLVVALLFALVMNAQDNPLFAKTYTDNMVVIINDESTDPMPTTIAMAEQEDGKYSLLLKNFILGSDEDIMAVGTICVSDLEPTVTDDGALSFSTEQSIMLQEGDMEGIDFWVGPILTEQAGAIPITLKANLSADREQLTAEIDIDFTILEQKIKVLFGQILIDYVAKIGEIQSGNNLEQKAIYNLQGQKVGADFNGIVIVNGKKIIKK